MTLFRVTLRLTAPLGTPLVGPTLFGQVCWAILDSDGESALSDWLDDPDRAWTVSDGFPAGYLPRPLVTPRVLSPDDLETIKQRKKRIYVSRAAWLEHRGNWDEARLPIDALIAEPSLPRRMAHNHVHRSGRGTLEEGGLFFLEEDWRFSASGGDAGIDPGLIDVYVSTADDRDRVKRTLSAIGQQGYGRDASTGRGRWDVLSVEEDRELADCDGSRMVSLSRGVIDPDKMGAPLWRLEAHYGRTGPQLSLAGGSPFKRPVLLTRPGMTFSPKAAGPYGRMLGGLHQDHPEIRLNAQHIAIPFSETSEDAA
ncbi:type III-A CRISPR-associated RAMP protein Csm4 [Jhaorihella thermophila]|uniref:CRISPR system Cms protein Csm4 n=1 Tax=Jhaorihella thermophila TaxID=488547 RepID=A0A1H5WYN2_9RHOB|nr:hypothetical protein [Jhaorihella thermophila]SEG04634.1 CRISPR-associated protein Csm4 [Jhaorihella thermophila]